MLQFVLSLLGGLTVWVLHVCVCVYVLWQVAALSVLSENEVTRLQQS